MILNLIATTYIDELFNRALIQEKFNTHQNDNRLLKYKKLLIVSLSNGLLGAISLGSMFLIFWDSYLVLGALKLSFPILGLLAGFGLFTIFGFLNAFIYQKFRSIIPASIFQATIIIWFTATMLVIL